MLYPIAEALGTAFPARTPIYFALQARSIIHRDPPLNPSKPSLSLLPLNLMSPPASWPLQDSSVNLSDSADISFEPSMP